MEGSLHWLVRGQRFRNNYFLRESDAKAVTRLQRVGGDAGTPPSSDASHFLRFSSSIAVFPRSSFVPLAGSGSDPDVRMLTRKVDGRLPEKKNSNSHGARPVHLIIMMIQWIRTSRLSIKNSRLSFPWQVRAVVPRRARI